LRLTKKGVFGFDGTGDGPNGGWNPHRIHLFVNDEQYAVQDIDQWIDASNQVWRHDLRPFDHSGERFARSLRLFQNEGLSEFAKASALVITPLVKAQGISGWWNTSLPTTCATGTLIRDPIKSFDGLATIDLEVESVQVGGQQFILDGQHGIGHSRYLRVECPYEKSLIFEDLLSGVLPSAGQRMTICGEVKWDTDHEGWFEIHPQKESDIKTPTGVPTKPQFLSLRQILESWHGGINLSTGVRPLAQEILQSSSISMKKLMQVLLSPPAPEDFFISTPKASRC
jgi:hypothetical protein